MNPEIDLLNRKVMMLSTQIESRNSHLVKYQRSLEKALKLKGEKQQKILRDINQDMKKLLDFEFDFDLIKVHFEEIHPSFYKKLSNINPSLTHKNLRLAAFIKMHLSNKEIAFLLNISYDGIKKSIQRLRKKLNVVENNSLRALIHSIG